MLTVSQTTTCRSPRSMASWLEHIRGATALLELRGEDQLHSEFGRTLFVQTRAYIIAGCLQTRTVVPEVVDRLSEKGEEVERSLARQKSSTRLLGDMFYLVSRFSRLRTQKKFDPEPSQSELITRTLIAEYSTLAGQMSEWHQRLPTNFMPAGMRSGDPSTTMLSEHDYVYDDIWTAGVANNCSTTHILVNEALIVQLIHLRDHFFHNVIEHAELDVRISQARSTVTRLIDAVCASVPHLLQSDMAIAGVGLIWALYVAAQISPQAVPLDTSTRGWINGSLERIGKEMGVKQATTLARMLREGVEIEEMLASETAERVDWTA
jgi:hypothetical protein